MNHTPLFIVDNSQDGWAGLDYLREWTDLAKSFDIATGYFEVGALLDLDGHWQKLDQIRILMGDEFTHRTRKALETALKERAVNKLDSSLESEKESNPFLRGLGAILDGLRTGKITCKVYSEDKFHAKAYITHGRSAVLGAQALVGSSNFTRPGLTQNVELNIKVESDAEVQQLQEWFEFHWDKATDVTPEIEATIERQAEEFLPFDVYAKSLAALFQDESVSASAWDRDHSTMYPKLDRYQQEAYGSLMSIARQHGGALLCDGVGLGKTYVGLMLIERLVVHENKRVVLFAPKAVKDAVWEKEIKRHLSHVGGATGDVDFSNLTIFSHTDLTRPNEFPERFARIAQQADAVIIDEAHHFRNRGSRGDEDRDGEDQRSRYYRLYDLINTGRRKSTFLLTATPINNSLNDFKHLVELFSGQDDGYFAKTLGVTSLSGRLNALAKTLKSRTGIEDFAPDIAEEATEVLAEDALFQGLVVQRSRAYARQSQLQETGSAAAFPTRDDPNVAEYSIRRSYGKLLDLVDTAFKRDRPLFALPMYYPLAYYTGPDESIDPIESNRQAQVVGLIRTNFLKRFESSVRAFEMSCDRLLMRILAFAHQNSVTDAEKARLERWLDQHPDLLNRPNLGMLPGLGDPDSADEDDDIVPQELLEQFPELDRDLYDVPSMLAETFLDLDQIAVLLSETRQFDAKHDDKLKKLTALLQSKNMSDRKVLIFTEFADTARYVASQLSASGIEGVFQLDSGTKTNRAEVIKRFSPYYNGSSSSELVAAAQAEIRVLITTDVLSEGLNLQDATRLINYDIHWNPVRLMQRIGRVDRRLNPDIESRIVADHPATAGHRGHIAYWNFLPPDELNEILSLYAKVSHKTLLISKTLGIEGKKLLRPEDDYQAIQEFNASYEGAPSALEMLHLEFQRLLSENAWLEDRLRSLPALIHSGRRLEGSGRRCVFFCYRLPALDVSSQEFTLEAGTTRWYLVDLGSSEITENSIELVADTIRSLPKTARVLTIAQDEFLDARRGLLKHLKNTYMRQLDLPIDAPKPSLITWMELH